ncbi:MAG: 5-oxoprolinase, partial [Magnetococcales bacterium]|nr:5-oxoprolinase [Magnetococcales bacterium]
SGDSQVIGFDMGGTSTDVCRVAQTLEHHLTATTAGITFQADRLRVETVAAGGGSILDFDGQKLTVGPGSAGADPGPACYGLGGPATLTDANVVLGRLAAQHLPKTFGPDRNQPLDEQASHRVLTALQHKMAAAGVAVSSLQELAMGFVTIADETMAAPIRTLSISRGFDPRQHSLLSFGGAGGQHACGVARHLEMACIRIPPLAGLLSAVGMGLAARTIQKMRSLLLPLSAGTLQQAWQVAGQMAQEIHPTAPFAVQVELRTPGTDACLPLPLGRNYQDMVQGFATTHQNHYGFAPVEQGVEMVHLRVTVTLEEDSFPPVGSILHSQEKVSPMGWQGVYFLGRDGCLVQQQTPVYEWSQLPAGWSHAGAALIVGPWSTVVVEPDFVVGVENTGMLTLTPQQQGVVMPAREERDPVLLELFNHRFMAIATNMGETLARTAHSVNIKERLDFSCAVFDAEGRLIANAPHIPVHLGAMGACVTDLYQQKGALLRPGDVYISNDPVAGGSHLPDVTAISPVFRGDKVAFFVASRGHHADMGGITPGSMPPFAKTLQEEGVVLRNVPLVQGGVFLGEAVTALLAVPPYPARNLPERLSDLRAQAAANQQGVNDLITLCQRHGDRVVAAYMDYMRQAARQAMEAVLNQMLGEKSEWYGHFEDSLDGGERVACEITLRRDEEGRPHATIDFVGTASQQENNLNAPSAVVRSAVLYSLRTLISHPIPLNDGCLEPVTLIIPEGCLLKPAPQAAVAAGNVETSQRLVDVLLGALGVAAASQGTMNNFLFGRPDGLGVPYYETIAGGAGATAEGDGASGVHVHMTNTRITDPEILETRLPHVRLEAFHLALSTGGEGRYKGGDGVVRILRFLQPMTVSLLTQRRTLAPFGLAGGQAGQRGENRLLHADGREEILPGHCQVQVAAGDAIRIQTPGGGGFGDK